MAEELEISTRTIRELQLAGMPFTQLHGLIWCEPDKVHRWLDRFTRNERDPVTKGPKAVKLVDTIVNGRGVT